MSSSRGQRKLGRLIAIELKTEESQLPTRDGWSFTFAGRKNMSSNSGNIPSICSIEDLVNEDNHSGA